MSDERFPEPAPAARIDAANRERVVRRAALVSAGTGVSRLLGFARDVLLAHFLGAGPVADVFLAALRLPNILRRLLTEGAVAMPFIPVYFRLLHAAGEERANTFARATRAWTLLLSWLFCGAGLLLPLPLLLALAPGLVDRFAELPGGASFAAGLMRIALPYVPFILLSCVNSALLQARGNYLAPALAPCILNVCFILPILALLASGHLNFFQHSPQTTKTAALALAWALPLAGVCQMLYLGGAVKRGGFKAPDKAQWRDTAVFRLARILPASLCITAAHQIAVLIAIMAASFLPDGYITQVHFADQLIELPLGLFGMALAVAVLPGFSTLAAPGRREELREAVALSLRMVLFVALPAAAGLLGLAFPVVDLLFGHGAFDRGAVEGCAALLAGYALGLPALAAARPLIAAIHALQRMTSAAKAALVTFAVTGLACLTVVLAAPALARSTALSLALGLGVSLGALAFTALLLRILAEEKAAPGLRHTLKAISLPLGLSLGIAVICRLSAGVFPEHSLWLVLILAPGCALSYAAICLAAGYPEARQLLALFLSKTRRKKTRHGAD